MQRPLSLILTKPATSAPVVVHEKAGVVYTKPWIVELMLDLAGYSADRDLVSAHAVEPSAGEGAFLISMALRLIRSCKRQKRKILECKGSLLAYELEDESADILVFKGQLVTKSLTFRSIQFLRALLTQIGMRFFVNG
jgi:hypothetical protein